MKNSIFFLFLFFSFWGVLQAQHALNEELQNVLISNGNSCYEVEFTSDFSPSDLVAPSFQTFTEQTLVKESSSQLEIVPAELENVGGTATEAYSELTVVPATFVTVTEQMLLSPSYLAYTVSESKGKKAIIFSAEVPAQYKTIAKQVLQAPASTQETTKQTPPGWVLKTPASTREIAIPAEYKTIEVKRLMTPSSISLNNAVVSYQKKECGKVKPSLVNAGKGIKTPQVPSPNPNSKKKGK